MAQLTTSLPTRSLALDRVRTGLSNLAAFSIVAGIYYLILTYALPASAAGGTDAERIAFAVVVAVSGFLGGLYAQRFFARGPLIAIGPDGVVDRRLTRRPIPWSAIRSIGPAKRFGKPFVAIDADPAAIAGAGPTFAQRVAAPVNRYLGNTALCIVPTGVEGGMDAILAAIEAGRPTPVR